MYVVSVTVHVKSEFVARFIEAVLDNARNTRREPGNIRFDVSQAEDDPSRFLLYEVYHSKQDFAVHQQTAHYLRWKEAVADWMAQPRQGIRHRAIFYGDRGQAACMIRPAVAAARRRQCDEGLLEAFANESMARPAVSPGGDLGRGGS